MDRTQTGRRRARVAMGPTPVRGHDGGTRGGRRGETERAEIDALGTRTKRRKKRVVGIMERGEKGVGGTVV